MDKLDILNREEFVDKLVTLTENISANKTSTSFAINGVWGCGKSFVLDMYEERLNAIQSEETANDKYFIIRYNCWKYDYYEEPLVAIVAAMIDVINQKTKLWNDEQKKARVLGVLKAAGTTLLSMVNAGVKDKIGVDIKNTYETLKTTVQAEEEKVEKSHKYDVYFSFNQALHRLQKLIAELSQDQTVVFMVDELDRCLPEYSIKVLERLHHLTEGSNNVITVLSIDKEQLQTSVKQIFGFDEPKKYLEKFIKFELGLNLGSVSEKITEKHKGYIDLFDKDKIHFNDSIEEFMQAVFQRIGVREQEQLMHRVELAHRLLFEKGKDYSFMCAEILIAVLSSHYGSILAFTGWLDQFYQPIEFGKQKPPFDLFFQEKFDGTPMKEIVRMGGNVPRNWCCFSYEKSLYGAIAYIWYEMHVKNGSIGIDVESNELKTILKQNVDDLKKFVETLGFIK